MGSFLENCPEMNIGIHIVAELCLILSTFEEANSYDLKSNCDAGWVDLSSSGLGCIRFDVSAPGGRTWEEANAYCWSEHNTHQVIIADSVQFEKLVEELENIYLLTGHQYAWTAGSDAASEGYWYFPVKGSCTPVPDIWHSASGGNRTKLFDSCSSKWMEVP